MDDRSRKLMDERVRDQIAEHGEVLPPWDACPDIDKFSIGWRMGGREWHLIMWWHWWKATDLGQPRRLEYFRSHLPPTEWLDWAAEAIWPDTVVFAYHLALLSGKPYTVARKKRTPITAETRSIAASSASTFWLGQQHAQRLRGRHVLVVDEVTSTGSTLRALRHLAVRAGAATITQAVIATERSRRDDVISVAHLPVWT